MKLPTKYYVFIVLILVMCAVMIITYYFEYTSGKQIVSEEIYSAHSRAYSVQKETETSESDIAKTVNINTATAQELADFLPGIGIVKAESIVAYREAIGGFKSVDELIEVQGIGESTLEKIRAYCRVTDD